MLRASRSPALLRRAAAAHSRHQLLRRFLHEDSSRGSDFPTLTLSTPHLADPRFGMDLTHAPGYEVAADDDPPLVPSQKVVDFAVRHARLSAAEVDHVDGYIWVGNVLYPSGIAPDPDIAFSWEIVREDASEHDDDDEDDDCATTTLESARDDEGANNSSTEPTTLADVSNTQFSPQAKRVRKERLRTVSRRSRRFSKKRSSRNRDVAEEDEDC